MFESKPIRIVHVVGAMNRGGAETMIMNIYRNIDRTKVQFDFAVHTDKKCDYDDEIFKLGGRIFQHPRPKDVGLKNFRKSFERMLNENGPFKGVHSHVHYFSGFVLDIAKKFGVPLRLAHSHSTHDGKKDSFLRSIYRWQMRKMIKKNATHLLGCSYAANLSLYGDKSSNDHRVMIIPNAIDLEAFNKTKVFKLLNVLNIPDDVLVLGHIGRLSLEKNHFFLLKIFREFVKNVPNAHMVMVGDGPLKMELEKKIGEYGLSSNVHLLGIRNDIPEILSIIDVFILPSLYEGIPLALIEAQAAGVPCVVSSSVSKESVIIPELINFIDLKLGPQQWVNYINQSIKIKRLNWLERSQILRTAGYDISLSAHNIESIYTEV